MQRRRKDMQRTSKFSREAWHRMSYRSTIQTGDNAEIRCQPVRVLAAIGACLLFQAYLIPFTNVSASDTAQFSSDLESGSSPTLDDSSLVVLPSHDTGTSHEPFALRGDFPICVASEDPDASDEDPRYPQAFARAGRIPPGEFSSHHSPQTRSLPFLEIQGLMSRRF